MVHKQASLFDFDEPATLKNEAEEMLHDVKQEAEPIVVNEEPVNIEFIAPIKEEIIVSILSNEKKNTRGRIKISDMEASAGLVEVPEDDILFTKKYYGIGAVAEMFKVNISLIRFWEKEFDILKPKLNGKGDRHFRPEDVKNLKQIYHLLREKKYTIEGAREFLKKNKKSEESFVVIEELKKMQLFLNDLKLSL
jgi:DNA-binding transcriptional MerR regulator